MIGGIDLHLTSMADRESLEVAVRVIRTRWPQAAFADAIEGNRFSDFWDIPFAALQELFVYRDSHAADAWEEEGAVPSLYNTMMHLIYDPGVLTVVIDEKTEEMDDLVNAIRRAINGDIFFISADLEVAA